MSVAAASKPMIFGVGLSRTGTSSLTAALEAMGIATIHNDRAFTPHLHDEHGGHSYNFTHHFENFYDRKGAVVDIPTAAYYKELLVHYGDRAKFILTERNPSSWFASFASYLERLCKLRHGQQPRTVAALHKHVYGSEMPNATLWKARFVAHNKAVRAAIPTHQLLVLNVTRGDGYRPLCEFLGSTAGPCASRGDHRFPHLNQLAALPEPAAQRSVPCAETAAARKCAIAPDAGT